MSAELEMMRAERTIARALAGIARAMDERRWEAFDSLVAADATADFGLGPLTGRPAIVTFIRSFLDDCGPTQHLLGNLIVDVATNGVDAQSRCYVSDMHVGAGDKAHLTFSTLGEYHDRWSRRGDAWWLVHRTKLNRAHVGSIGVLGPGPQQTR